MNQNDKLELTTSLDLTKVQIQDEQSRFDTERELLEEGQRGKLKAYAASLVQLMKDQGVNVEAQAEQGEFEELLQSCKLAFNNYAENRRSLQRMIDEREEQAREREDIEFQRERAIAELELLKKQVQNS